MFENNTDRMFWTIAALILAFLLMTITLKASPAASEAIFGSLSKNSNTAQSSMQQNAEITQKDADLANMEYKFTKNDQGDDVAWLIGYHGKNNDITIPDYVYNRDLKKPVPVTNLASTDKNGLFPQHNLTHVVIPETVIYIGDNSLSNNKLSRVDIPSSVTHIGSHAFDNNQLTDPIITKNANEIGNSAFANNPLNQSVQDNLNHNWDSNVTKKDTQEHIYLYHDYDAEQKELARQAEEKRKAEEAAAKKKAEEEAAAAEAARQAEAKKKAEEEAAAKKAAEEAEAARQAAANAAPSIVRFDTDVYYTNRNLTKHTVHYTYYSNNTFTSYDEVTQIPRQVVSTSTVTMGGSVGTKYVYNDGTYDFTANATQPSKSSGSSSKKSSGSKSSGSSSKKSSSKKK